MATRRALELGQRLYEAHRAAKDAWRGAIDRDDAFNRENYARSIQRLERAAIAVGIEREWGRQRKASSGGLPPGFTRMLPEHLQRKRKERDR